jgi:hypothetical protein
MPRRPSRLGLFFFPLLFSPPQPHPASLSRGRTASPPLIRLCPCACARPARRFLAPSREPARRRAQALVMGDSRSVHVTSAFVCVCLSDGPPATSDDHSMPCALTNFLAPTSTRLSEAAAARRTCGGGLAPHIQSVFGGSVIFITASNC